MSDLPIRRVVLYKHGVGYFERETQIDGDQSLASARVARHLRNAMAQTNGMAVGQESNEPQRQKGAEVPDLRATVAPPRRARLRS